MTARELKLPGSSQAQGWLLCCVLRSLDVTPNHVGAVVLGATSRWASASAQGT